ncbi:hypothetical protein HK102_008629 [Quaeritorhiza haematococci]|nr:hypothetical protein HK102_008629 [Quaeritorhiza haematococci]
MDNPTTQSSPITNSYLYSSLPTRQAEIDSKLARARKELLTYALLKYIASALASPWEVAHILQFDLVQQVQYTPSASYLEYLHATTVDGSEEDQTAEDEENGSDDEENDPYHIEKNVRFSTQKADGSAFHYVNKPADSDGYLLRTSFDPDDPTRPPYQLPVLPASVSSVVSDLIKQKDEGWISLWKGHLSDYLYDMLHMTLQPAVENYLNDIFDIVDDSIPIIHLDHVGPNLATLVTSHTVAGLLLSPLELARTRLVVQTLNPYHRKYKGTLHCLKTVVREEGWATFFGGRNLLPNVLYHSLSALFHHTKQLVIERIFHVFIEEQPFLFRVFELGLNTLELAVMLPVETVRARLHCQIHPLAPMEKAFEPVVQLSPVPYLGMVDCLRRIVLEEDGGGKIRKGKRRNKRGKVERLAGFRRLYKGFRYRFFTLVGFTALNMLTSFLDIEE